MILVRAFPRLHLGLLDVSRSGQRAYGGSGVMLDTLPIEVTIDEDLSANENAEIDQVGRAEVESAVARMKQRFQLKRGAHSIQSAPPQHIGLGTKTALLLGVLTAWEQHSKLELTPQQLQMLSGRGGTSGVGIHGFFRGGFIVDAGHPAASVNTCEPSAARTPPEIPMLTLRCNVDENWRFVLLLTEGRRYFGGAEIDFFKRNTPIPVDEAREAIAITHHGIVPSVLSGDLESLRLALRRLHTCGFKQRELMGQTDDVRGLLRDLDELQDCAVGMSSMGPLIYAIVSNGSSEVRTDILACAQSHKARVLACCPARNLGHEIQR